MASSAAAGQPAVASGERPVGELGAVDYAEAAAECDVVMKGGITSGVIYPLAVCELARRYQLRNVGGSSAGAIAAAAAAAAERGRRRQAADPTARAGGYGRLAELPDWLGGNLSLLFQPAPSTRPLFAIVMAASKAPKRPVAAGPAGTAQAGERSRSERGKRLGPKLWPILRAAIWQRRWWVLGGLAVPLALAALAIWLGGPPGAWPVVVLVVFGAVLGIVLGLVLAALSLYRVAVNGVRDNFYGVCTGHLDAAGVQREQALQGRPPTLTGWLADLLDELAGAQDHPLTFGDLWGAAAADAYRAAYRDGQHPTLAQQAELAAAREINLEMMTTDLSNGRPWRLPIEQRVFSFCPAELRRLFPERIVRYMCDHSVQATRHVDGAPAQPLTCPRPEHHGEALYHLPRPPDLPVVVATRMSLSFPLLISAVPLYMVDYQQTDRPVVCCWFSDGGITSNFPIHFFDSLLPRRPTFGLNLRTYPPDHPHEDVYLPPLVGALDRTSWRPITSLFGFGAMLMDTMQNWSDAGQMTLPGFRDRIAHVSHRADEGGMNLAMPHDTIQRLAERGWQAARLFTCSDPPGGRCFDWEEHRWTRYRTAMCKLQQGFDRMAAVYGLEGLGYRDFLATFQPQHYRGLAGQEARWEESARAGLAALIGLAGGWQHQPLRYTDNAPEPDPDLRMTPRF